MTKFSSDEILVSKNKSDAKVKDYYLKEFLVEPDNQLAYDVACSLVENSVCEYNPLVFYGPQNSGKTHLLSAICKGIREHSSDVKIIYLNAEEFHTEYVRALRTGQYQGFREIHRSCQYFFLENLHTLKHKKKTQQELIFTMNTLQERSSQILISSRLPVKDLCLNPALVNRLTNGLMIKLEPLSKKAVIDYCRNIASLYGVSEEEGAIDTLWNHFGDSFGNFKMIFHHLLILFAQKKQPLSLTLVKDGVNFYLKKLKPVTLEEILQAVSDYYQVSVDSLKEKNGSKSLSISRAVAILLAKDIVGMNISEIQENFAGRSESSIRYVLNKISMDPKLQTDYEEIRRKLLLRLERSDQKEERN